MVFYTISILRHCVTTCPPYDIALRHSPLRNFVYEISSFEMPQEMFGMGCWFVAIEVTGNVRYGLLVRCDRGHRKCPLGKWPNFAHFHSTFTDQHFPVDNFRFPLNSGDLNKICKIGTCCRSPTIAQLVRARDCSDHTHTQRSWGRWFESTSSE